MPAPAHAGRRKAQTLRADQTILLACTRCTLRDLAEKLQDQERELRHVREQFREMQLDYSHTLARLWSMNARIDRASPR